MATIETMSKARGRIKVKAFFYTYNAPSAARDRDKVANVKNQPLNFKQLIPCA